MQNTTKLKSDIYSINRRLTCHIAYMTIKYLDNFSRVKSCLRGLDAWSWLFLD